MEGVFRNYMAKPLTVEAVRFTDQMKDRIRHQLTGQYSYGWEGDKPILKVTTIHGEVAIVRLGDWIVKEPQAGFYYPITNEQFERKYYQARGAVDAN